jgi:hypothetical protein
MGCGSSSTAGTVSDVHPTSTVAAAPGVQTNEQQQQVKETFFEFQKQKYMKKDAQSFSFFEF